MNRLLQRRSGSAGVMGRAADQRQERFGAIGAALAARCTADAVRLGWDGAQALCN